MDTTHTLAKLAPWQGVDAHTPGVDTCTHRWVTHRVGDVVRTSHNPDEPMTFCARCYVPRCELHYAIPESASAIGYFPAFHVRCTQPRHHRDVHRFWTGREWVTREIGT